VTEREIVRLYRFGEEAIGGPREAAAARGHVHRRQIHRGRHKTEVAARDGAAAGCFDRLEQIVNCASRMASEVSFGEAKALGRDGLR